MQQAGDDMDDLFRKAAENYPLKTDNADWEKVRPLLLPVEDITNTASSKKNYKKLLWLLLLLPLGWAGYKFILHKNNELRLIQADQNNTSLHSKKVPSNVINQAKPNDQKNTTNFSNAGKAVNLESSADKRLSSSLTKNSHITKRSIKAHTAVSIVASGQDAIAGNSNQSIETNKEKTNTAIISDDYKSNHIDNNTDENIEKKEGKKEDQKVNIIDTAKAKRNKVIITKSKKQHGFYAGLITGIDVSTVKFQSTKKAGFNIGVIAGYKFNKIFSIESGAIWNKKFYYTDGKHFNTAKVYVPAGSKIDDVNGYCEMIEVPVNLKINIISSAKSNWFSVAGLSSYFMKNEDYNYAVTNAWGTYPYSKKYKESTSFLLAAVNLGIGYSHSIGKGGTLRIEPYAKIPLSGVGIGKLPITSAGINIGFTKKLFK